MNLPDCELKLIELLGAKESELKGFTDLVQKRNGRIQVQIHLWYLKGTNPAFQSYLYGRDRFISACISNQIPLVILEQSREYDLLKQRIQNKTGTIYTLITRNDDNLPYGGRDSWMAFTEILRNAGVVHASVGGTVMSLQKFSNKDEYGAPKLTKPFLDELRQYLRKERLSADRWVDFITLGCAGATARYLALSGIDVSISPFSYPHNLKSALKA